MAPGKKTGGRVKGVSFNKVRRASRITPSKTPHRIMTAVSTHVIAAAAAAAAGGADIAPPSVAHVRVRSRARPPRKPRKAASEAKSIGGSLLVEVWPISRLKPYERNPRDNDGSVARMSDALREFGFRIPIVARSDGTIVDGHLRYKAARKLRLSSVPVALADDLSETQVRAFRLMANRSATWATWDTELLKLEVEDLKADSYALDLTGFNPDELATLLDKPLEVLSKPKRTTTTMLTCPHCNREFAP